MTEMSHNLAETVLHITGMDPAVQSGPLAALAHASEVKRVLVQWFVEHSTAMTRAKVSSKQVGTGWSDALQRKRQ